MVFNATFNNISVRSWQSVLLVGETGVPGENHQPVTSHWKTIFIEVETMHERFILLLIPQPEVKVVRYIFKWSILHALFEILTIC